MNGVPLVASQHSTVLCPSCGLVWTGNRLAPAPCPECGEVHVVFRGRTYYISEPTPAIAALAS